MRLRTHNHALDALDLSCLPWDKCSLGHEVAAAFASNTLLSRLILEGNSIRDAGATAVVGTFGSNLKHNLRTLDLSDNDVTARGAGNLAICCHRSCALGR